MRKRGGNPLRGGSPLEDEENTGVPGFPRVAKGILRHPEFPHEGGGEGGGGATLAIKGGTPYGGVPPLLGNGALTSPFPLTD